MIKDDDFDLDGFLGVDESSCDSDATVMSFVKDGLIQTLDVKSNEEICNSLLQDWIKSSDAADNYVIFRGNCREFCEKLIEKDSTLQLVRGHYICPIWGTQPHWWCVNQDGKIIDPTVKQFPTAGVFAEYIPFNGMCECANCGEEVAEEEADIEGNYAFCSTECHMRFVGL